VSPVVPAILRRSRIYSGIFPSIPVRHPHECQSQALHTSADAERAARSILRLLRLADRFGLNEDIDNHLTLLVRDIRTDFYSRPSHALSEVKASDFWCDSRTSKRAGSWRYALYIHQRCIGCRRRACVLHTPHAVCDGLCMLENPRLEMACRCARFYERRGLRSDVQRLVRCVRGERLARALGQNQCS